MIHLMWPTQFDIIPQQQFARRYHSQNGESFCWLFSFFHSLTKVLFCILRELSERHNNVSKWRLHEYWSHCELLLLLPSRSVWGHVWASDHLTWSVYGLNLKCDWLIRRSLSSLLWLCFNLRTGKIQFD